MERVLIDFVNLIEGGLSEIKKDFIESGSAHVDYDEKLNAVTGMTETDGLWDRFQVSFDEYLREQVKPVYHRAIASYQKAFLVSPEHARELYRDELARLKAKLVHVEEDEGREVVRDYLNQLEQVIVGPPTTSSQVSKRGPKPIHKANKEWLVGRFNELREQDPDAASGVILLDVAAEYCSKYGKEISPSTIRTYLGIKRDNRSRKK